jgi:hypothetical protein
LRPSNLCKTHNSPLSPLDEAGKAMFLAMDGMNMAWHYQQLSKDEQIEDEFLDLLSFTSGAQVGACIIGRLEATR